MVRADVDRQAERLFDVAGLHAHRLAILPDRDRHLPVPLAHDLLQAAEQHGVQPHVLQPEARVELGRDAVPVAQLVLQRRRLHLDVVEPDRRVDDDRALGGRLAHDLLARLAFLGHEHDQVAQHLAATGQPAAVGARVLLPVVRLAAIRRRQMIGGGRDAVLGEDAVLDGDLAFAARLLAAANGLDLDAEHACGIEQVGAGRDLALAAGGLKNDSAGRWVGLLAHGLVV